MNDKQRQIISGLANIVFYASIILLVLCLAMPVFIKNSNYEFVDGGKFFDMFVVSAIPLSILLTISRMFTWRKINSSGLAVFRVVGTFLLSFIVFFYLMLTTALELCTTSYNVLFESKENSSIQILNRSFGCGAIDSTPNSNSVVKAEKKLFGLMHLTKTDTTALDKNAWIRKNE